MCTMGIVLTGHHFAHRDELVHVELHDATFRDRVFVTTITAGLLKVYVPFAEDRIIMDQVLGGWALSIYVPSLEHVAHIEVLALRWLFQQMTSIVTHTLNWNCLPAHASVGQGVLLYRALQLLYLDDAAQTLRPQVMYEIKLKPLSMTDVQRIWWAFQYTEEWGEWLNVMLRNLAYFNVYSDLSDGSYIRLFIETEMLQLTPAEQDYIEGLYRYHKEEFRKEGFAGTAKAYVKWALGLVKWENRDLHREYPAPFTVRCNLAVARRR
ncbi:hypothetical protein BU26DRAFT_277694 [Trematosphaeria pertusa]|uniref:Uncharacterized protein n=1 Tax=Trematosphaeria pertusa TaxID=390896 RepID=A0A6A6IL68_9PLEO|nr:uncharacterized protein BU26DRAFT_277694 [Trematosphaeria pertusa]KAF2251171.1 hypothetical protein BU26DRAFT_277694 [Trematosphaeria pertusa]